MNLVCDFKFRSLKRHRDYTIGVEFPRPANLTFMNYLYVYYVYNLFNDLRRNFLKIRIHTFDESNAPRLISFILKIHSYANINLSHKSSTVITKYIFVFRNFNQSKFCKWWTHSMCLLILYNTIFKSLGDINFQ